MVTPSTSLGTEHPWTVVLAMFGVCVVALGAATLLLLLLGGRLRFASRIVGIVLGMGLAIGAGWAATALWSVSPTAIVVGEVVLAVVIAVVALARPRWNPPAQLFAGAALASSLVYVAFGAAVTFGGYFGTLGMIASAFLLVLEIAALTLSASFAFESLDAVSTAGPASPERVFDPSYVPMVSLQIAAYNEPPDMLLEVIRTAEAIDYPRFEIVVIDNNTRDPAIWQPVRDYCADRPGVTFVHVEDWPGYKSGALNLALDRHTDPDAELIGVIDADYLVHPDYLKDVVGLFGDPSVAFVQTPQDYRAYEGDAYLTACYDAYRYFFLTSMPVRDRRNSIIFAGTMGLLRRDVLQRIGGWSEWCITEDAEASLRILRDGYQGVFVRRSYGRGIMPLTFSALKSQRFRWCFGGMQILRMHWRDLLPAPSGRHSVNHLTAAQRIDYLLGGLQWLNDLVLLGFSAVLLSIAAVLAIHGSFPLRPLLGAAALLPIALVSSGLLRALWALRAQAHIGWRRAFLAFASWLSLSWTVAIACLNGLARREGVFLRTPKEADRPSVLSAMWTTKAETLIAGLMWGSGAALALGGKAGIVLVALFAWQGAVYASAPFMAWMNQHTELSAQLERRRRSEYLRDRVGRAVPFAFGIGLPGAIAIAAVALSLFGAGTTTPPRAADPFSGSDAPAVVGSAPSPAATPSLAPTATPSVSASASVMPSPSMTGSVAPTPSVSTPASSAPSPTQSPSASAVGPSATLSPTPNADATAALPS